MITKVPGLENPRLIALTLTRTLTRTLNPPLIARLIARDSLAAARSSPLHAPRRCTLLAKESPSPLHLHS